MFRESATEVENLLKRVRTKETDGFSWGEITDVVTFLGGRVEKIVAAIPAKQRFFEDREEEAREKHDELKRNMVSGPPSKPKHGVIYVKELSPVVERGGDWQFDFEGYLGHAGYRVEIKGKAFNALPAPFTGSKSVVPVKPAAAGRTEALRWLTEEVEWDRLAMSALDLPPPEPVVPRALDNTGHCGVCFKNVKLRGSKIVLHGYERPGTGQAEGRCPGVGTLPFELSPNASKDYIDEHLKPALTRNEGYLARLERGEVKSLLTPRGKEIKEGEPNWDRLLDSEIAETKSAIGGLAHDLDLFQKVVQRWHERPLPKEGDPIVNYLMTGMDLRLASYTYDRR